MARIRTIKPSFWTDEKLGSLSRDARFLFLGIISAMCDDAGRARANPRLICSTVFPYDDDISSADIERLLSELAGSKLITVYAVETQRYLQVVKFKDHQKIDRPQASALPSFDESSTNHRRIVDDQSTGEGRGRDGSGMEILTTPPLRAREQKGGTPKGKPAVQQTDREATILDALPTDEDRKELTALLDSVPNRAAWAAEISASLSGMAGHVERTGTEIAIALRDYAGNGKTNGVLNLRQFRRYLEGARDPPKASASYPPKQTAGERMYQNAEAITPELKRAMLLE